MFCILILFLAPFRFTSIYIRLLLYLQNNDQGFIVPLNSEFPQLSFYNFLSKVLLAMLLADVLAIHGLGFVPDLCKNIKRLKRGNLPIERGGSMDREEETSVRKVVVSDIDNTLLEPLPDETLKMVKSALEEAGTKVGIVSRRPRFLIKLALFRMDLQPDFYFSAFWEDKAKHLRNIRNRFPQAVKYIYIGNSSSDKEEAEKAGFRFIWDECLDEGTCSL